MFTLDSKPAFLEQVVWPEFCELDALLGSHFDQLADAIVAEAFSK